VNLTDFDGNTLQEKIFAQRHNLGGATPVLAVFEGKGKRGGRHTGFGNKKDFLLLANYFVGESHILCPDCLINSHQCFTVYKYDDIWIIGIQLYPSFIIAHVFQGKYFI
jgi:hypothetical protein